MVYSLHNLYLAANRLFSLNIFDFLLLVDFKCDLLIVLLVKSEIYKRVCALANLFAN